MEREYRNAEGYQMDFWPPERTEPHWVWRKLPAIVVLIVIGMLWAPVVFAQESKAVILTNAMLCQEEDQLKNLLDVASSHDARQTPLTPIEGCAFIEGMFPAIITPTVEYENKYAMFMLATFQIPEMPVQYGYIAWRAKPPETEL